MFNLSIRDPVQVLSSWTHIASETLKSHYKEDEVRAMQEIAVSIEE